MEKKIVGAIRIMPFVPKTNATMERIVQYKQQLAQAHETNCGKIVNTFY